MKILAKGPHSVMEVMHELNKRGFKMKYRESVYRALEKLADAGLVQKYYDNKERGIRYRLLKAKIDIDFQSQKIS